MEQVSAKPRPRMSVEFGAGSRDKGKNEADFSDAFAELYGLLEDYAPPWYTERLHQRAQDALRMIGRL